MTYLLLIGVAGLIALYMWYKSSKSSNWPDPDGPKDVMRFLKFIKDMLTNKCYCGEKATNWPHGIPCCDKCNHEVECLIWLGDKCDCSKGDIADEQYI